MLSKAMCFIACSLWSLMRLTWRSIIKRFLWCSTSASGSSLPPSVWTSSSVSSSIHSQNSEAWRYAHLTHQEPNNAIGASPSLRFRFFCFDTQILWNTATMGVGSSSLGERPIWEILDLPLQRNAKRASVAPRTNKNVVFLSVSLAAQEIAKLSIKLLYVLFAFVTFPLCIGMSLSNIFAAVSFLPCPSITATLSII